MIINTEQNQISKIFKKSEMGIKVDGLAHQMMIDGIYSNKVNSVFREISTNARDSHIQAGVTTPFEITIFHSQSNASFCTVNIQDFGTGMSEEEVLTYLCNLNSSSKRDSNDVVGCFGIGSKSVFSLTNTYTYECVKDGVLTKLLLTKDKNGTPNFTHSSTATDRPNSVLCSFAIEQNVTRILTAIYEELTLFDIKPIIKIIKNNNNVFVKEPYETSGNNNIYYNPEDFFPEVVEYEHFYTINQKNKMSFIDDYFHNKHIACGVIGYKLDNYSFSQYYGYNNGISAKIGVLPKFELGSIKFGVSREIVENTAETDALLAKKFIDIYKTFPQSKNITNFLKVGNRFANIRYNRDSFDFRSDRRALLDDYSCDILSNAEFLLLDKDTILFEYLSKDYFKNKFNIRNKDDLDTVEFVFNRSNALFKLFNKIPQNVFLSILKASDEVDHDVLTFYLGSGVNNSDINKLRYYSGQSVINSNSIKKDLLYYFLTHNSGLKINIFNYDNTENGVSKYLYSHKTLGSNTHLENLRHKDINIIKVSRTQDLDKVDSALKVASDLFGLSITHLDDYKEIDPVFCNTLKPIRQTVARTESGDTDPGVSENGLRLRVKHDKIVIHETGYNDAPLSSKTYEGDTSLTSSQCYNVLNSLVNSYYPVIIFEDFILKDAEVMKDLGRKTHIVLLSEQSDPVEFRKILQLVKNNTNRSALLFFDKVLEPDFYNTYDDNFKVLLLRSAMTEFHNDIMDYATENLNSDITDIIKRAGFMFSNNEITNTVSRAYLQRHDNDLIGYCIKHISEFEQDFLSITSLTETLGKLKSAFYSENKEESLPLLRNILYGDNV